jgi:hypothetical protein
MCSTQPKAIPPQGTLLDVMVAAWRAKVLVEVSALDVAEVLHQHGPATSAELAEQHGTKANPEVLEPVPSCLRRHGYLFGRRAGPLRSHCNVGAAHGELAGFGNEE